MIKLLKNRYKSFEVDRQSIIEYLCFENKYVSKNPLVLSQIGVKILPSITQNTVSFLTYAKHF